VATLIYFIGFKGYQLQALQGYVSKQHTPKKVKDRLPRQRVVEIATKFEADVLDQKQYLNPKLSSQEVAEQLNVNQSALSYAINQQFGKSFRDLINEYRTNEVKTKLQDADYTNVSILAIALECGFNSEASFYRIFKKSTGMSPKDYSSL
jgi:AraC-like DNA-binding protein